MASTTSISFGDRNQALQVGVSHGPIYYTAASTSEQPEPRPEPLSTVPFPHDPDFVSRDELLDQIHEKSSIQGSRIVLVGLGGVGKSRLAIEHCHRVRQESPDTWVFWVHASNAARCEESLRNLADRAKIPGRQDRDSNIFQVFGNWLQDGKVGKWILVLDNVDDDELLQKPLSSWTDAQENTQRHVPTQPPLRYLLASSNGSIIVTSRNRAVALEIADHKKNLIDVLPMNSTDALLLLQNKLDESAEKEELVQLVEELEFMPLAITQAASYINHRSPRCSASQYLEKLRQSDRQATKLLEHEGKHMHRDWEAKNSILRTWQISFDYIRRIRKSAADLLSLMSFFDWQGIPEDLLRAPDKPSGLPQDDENRSSDEDADSSSESEGNEEFEHDIMILKDYSFITSGKDSTSTVFTMHRLVQLTARLWLKTHEQEEWWKGCFIINLYREFPTGAYENWERCRTLFPHVRSALVHRPKSQNSLHNWAALLYKGAWYATECGSILVAEDMAAMSRKQRIKMYGADHEEALDSTAMLAEVYEIEGRWEEAEQLNVQVLETRKMNFGAEHLSTLKSMTSLALIYSKQGRWKEAEQLNLQVMETRKRKLGANHPDTITSTANLASTLWKQGRWEEAEQLELYVMEISKIKLGVDHPDTLISMGNMALTYGKQGRWEKAEQLQSQVVEISKVKLGIDHPDTLNTMGKLALTLWNQGRWDEAEKIQVYAMERSKVKLGVDHPDTLEIMGNLALTLWDQGRRKEAEQLGRQVMEMSKIKLGADHPDTLTSMGNMASTLWNQGRWKEAEQLELQVMEISKTKLGADHPDTLLSMANLAFTWEATGQHSKAIDLLRACVAKEQQVLGPTHPDTVSDAETLLQWETAHLNIGA